MQVRELAGVAQGEPQGRDVVLEADQMDRSLRLRRSILAGADRRHGVVRGTQSDVPHHQRDGGRLAQPLAQPRLLHVERTRLDRRIEAAVHHLARCTVHDGRVALRRATNGEAVERRVVATATAPRCHDRGVLVVATSEVRALGVAVGRERAGNDVLPHRGHEVVVEAQVVAREELPPQRFVRLGEVVEIGARVLDTRRAGAAGVEGRLGELVDAAVQVQAAARRECHSLLGQDRRHGAVEHVDATIDRLQEVERGADAHEIAREMLGQERRRERGTALAFDLALADREAADRVAVERQAEQMLRALPPQVVEARAMDDAEERLRCVASCRQTSSRPTMRPVHGRGGGRMVRGGGDALVHRHQDIAPDRELGRDAALRTEHDPRAVDVATKDGAVLRDDAIAREGEHLVAAGVGQDRAPPVHETMDASDTREHLGARPQEQVVGVGEEHLRAGSFEILDREPLHRRMRADGHEERRLDLAVERPEAGRPCP